MSTTQSPGTQRFADPVSDPNQIAARVEDLLGSDVTDVVEPVDSWQWEFTVIQVSDITLDESTSPVQNAALKERDRAIARAKLTVGEAPPLVVITDENLLVDGHARVDFLQELDAEFAAVYRGLSL